MSTFVDILIVSSGTDIEGDGRDETRADESPIGNKPANSPGETMKYIAEFETNIGTIRAEWKGREYIHLYPNGSETACNVINVWDYANNKPLIDRSAKAMASYAREWLWEMERGIEFDRIITSEQEELSDHDEAW